ncbi:MAG: citrate/2-methylcitrate synthase [Clostridia bacterium]|nr:citrate/2-methylcitrate synthase [Clostridia bacterium]
MAKAPNPRNPLQKRIKELSVDATKSTIIKEQYYEEYDCKRGLRDINGKGVLVGLTEISEIIAAKTDENGNRIPCDGELYYRGIPIEDIVKGFVKEKRFGFEETVFLLLFGRLPKEQEYVEFRGILSALRKLPSGFLRDVIMKKPSADMMNVLQRSVLTLYAYDDNPDAISMDNVLMQCLDLIAKFPMLSVYGYQVFKHYHEDKGLIIHQPDPDMSTSENILHMLRPDGKFTPLEAKILDLCLVLHAEHGGGNNSTFTAHVVSSSGTDTYSAIAASLGSLKGPRHGGANAKVIQMMDDIAANAKSYSEKDIKDYLRLILDGKAFDRQGLIYGMGHAIYSVSDPRSKILKSFIKPLAIDKGLEKEYELYRKIEVLAPQVIAEKRKIYKGVSANVDFYSGFIYRLLGIPTELFTPIFAISRVAGWSAHRIEELANQGKIIRPAYEAVAPHAKYVKLQDRK